MRVRNRKITLIGLILCLLFALTCGILFLKKDSVRAGATSITGIETPVISIDEGASIRADNVEGIRFSAYVRDDVYEDGMTAGILLIPTYMLGDNELTVETASVKNITAKVWASTTMRAGTHQFNAVLTGIAEKDYATQLSARAYYKDGDNYVYSDTTAVRSIAQASSNGLFNGNTTEKLYDYVDGAVGSITITANGSNPLDLSATVTNASGASANADASKLQPVWSSSNPTKVAVDAEGNISLVGNESGTYSATITATLGNKSATHSFSMSITTRYPKENTTISATDITLTGNPTTTHTLTSVENALGSSSGTMNVLSFNGKAIASPAAKVTEADLGATPTNGTVRVIISYEGLFSSSTAYYIVDMPISLNYSDDTTAPVIKLNSGYTTSATVGGTVVVPSYSVVDDQLATSSYLSVSNPKGEPVRLADNGNSFVAMMAGEYTVKIMAWDAAGNTTMASITIPVTGGYIQLGTPIKVNLDMNADGSVNTTATTDLGIADILAPYGVTGGYTIQSIGETAINATEIPVSYWGSAYGVQDPITITVTANDDTYIIQAPVLLVSKVIKTADDLQSFGAIATELGNKYNGVNNTYGGYFELGSDVDMAGASFGQFNERDNDATSGTYGFDGVFDGCGYVISNAVSESQDGLLGVMTKNGVLKNVGFINAKVAPESGAYNFLGRTEFGAIENIYIQYAADGITNGNTKNFSLASGSYEEGDVTIKNVLIDASALTLTAVTDYNLTANTVPVSNQMYLILPNDYTSDLGYVFGWGGDNPGKDHGFTSYEALFANANAAAAVSEWEKESKHWYVDAETAEVVFVKDNTPTEVEVDNVAEWGTTWVNLDINNDGSLNDTNYLDFDLAEKLDVPFKVKIISVNGTAVTGGNAPASILGYTYGDDKTVSVVAKAGPVTYIINDMPVLLVSKVIKSADDLQSFGTIAAKLGNKYNGVNNTYGGYFELGSDIDMAGASFGQFNERDGDFTSGTYGFDGVFDGCGYVISNAVSESQDGLLGVMTKNGVLKNVGFTNAKVALPESGEYNFLGRTEFGAIENIYIQYAADGITNGNTRNFSLASGSYEEGDVTIKNVLVDGSALTISGTSAPLATNHAELSKSIYVIKPDSLNSFGWVYDWGSDLDAYANYGFTSYDALVENTTAWNLLSQWKEPWSIGDDIGGIFFGGKNIHTVTVKYTVTFDSNGGTEVDSKKVEEGKTFTAPTAPTKESVGDVSYAFAGWYVGDVEWNFDSDVVTENITLTAKWNEVSSVTVDASEWNNGKEIKVNLNLDSALSTANSHFVGFSLAEELGEDSVTIISVNGVAIESGVLPASFATLQELQTVSMVVQSANTIYEVSNVKLFLVSKVIYTVADYNEWGNVSKALNYGGYFELGADLSQEGGIAMVNWNTNSYWVSNATDYKGFSGTFDGCGYVIDGLKMTANTSNNGGFIGTMTQTGTLQNIGFTNLDFSGVTGTSKFIGTTVYGNMKNVYIHISGMPNTTNEEKTEFVVLGVVSKADAGLNANFTAENVFVDASAAKETDATQRFQMLPDNNWNDAFYAIAPTGANVGYYTSWKSDTEGEEHYNHAFNTYAEFKANATAWAAVSAWAEAEDSLWVVNAETGAVSYGHTAYANRPITENVDAAEKGWAQTKLNLNFTDTGAVNTEQTLELGLAEKLGVDSVTVLSVNGTAVTDGIVYASVFGTQYGETTISVVAKSGNVTYNISNMPVLLVSKVIMTVADYNAWGNISKALNYGGYFELGADLSQEGGIELVNWNTNSYYVSNATDYKGFSGTFDGCGYVIDGLKMTANGLNGGFVGTMTQTGTLKNIGFTNVDTTAVTSVGNLLGTTTYGAFENIYVQYANVTKDTRTVTFIDRSDIAITTLNVTTSKIFVDASAGTLTLDSSTSVSILPKENNGGGLYGVTPSGISAAQFCNWGAGNYTNALFTTEAAAATALADWNGTSYWVVNAETGEVTFGRNE